MNTPLHPPLDPEFEVAQTRFDVPCGHAFIMPRPSRWSDERKANREQADWIVKWLRSNGPATTLQIIEALEQAGRGVHAHVLQRALRRSPFVHNVGSEEGPRGRVSRWMFAVEDPSEGGGY